MMSRCEKIKRPRVIKKNIKPARHPDATSVDDHNEGHNFINIEGEEKEIDQAKIDETRDCHGHKRKYVDFTAFRERKIKKLSLVFFYYYKDLGL